MWNIKFLKENKLELFILLLLPLFIFYFDRSILLFIKEFHKSFPLIHLYLELIDPVINFFSHGLTLLVIIFIIFFAGKYYNASRVLFFGRAMIISFIITGIVVQILKHIIGRARPRITDYTLFLGPSIKSGFDSFPSGHTAIVFSLAYVFSRELPEYKLLFYFLAFVVAFERVEDFSHFPSDVLAGAIIGILLGKLLSNTLFYRGIKDVRIS
ncbi:MAG: phosphatase PAP2 family protein [Caldimicrobium sp.]